MSYWDRLWSIIAPAIKVLSPSVLLIAFTFMLFGIMIVDFNFKYCVEQCPAIATWRTMGLIFPNLNCFLKCFSEPLLLSISFFAVATILVVLVVEAWRWKPKERTEILKDVKALEDKMPFDVAEVLPKIKRYLPLKLYRDLLEAIEAALEAEYRTGYESGAIDYGTDENYAPRREVLHMWPP